MSFFGRFLLAACLLTGAIGGLTRTALAAPEMNESGGYWEDRYEDLSGVNSGASSNISHDSAGRFVSQANPANVGVLVTSLVNPVSYSGWMRLYIKHTASATGDIRVIWVPDGGSATELILQASDVPGYSAMADLSGFAATGGAAVHVELSKNGAVKPALQGLKVTWVPKSVLKVGLTTGSATGCSGAELEFRVRASVSFVATEGLVVWVPMPTGTLPADALAAGLGQNVTPEFVRAASGGLFTPAALVVDGVSIPDNSVYWRLGDRRAGDTFQLSFVVRPPQGTLAGTLYKAKAHGLAGNATQADSGFAEFAIASLPTPYAYKFVSGAFRIFDEWRTYNDQALTFNIYVLNNTRQTCGETFFKSVVWDQIGNLGAVAGIADRPGFDEAKLQLYGGGKYTSAGTTVNGVPVPAKSVYWDNVAPLESGEARIYSYKVALWGERTNDSDPAFPKDLLLQDKASLASGFRAASSTATLAVRIGIPNEPHGIFALGDRIRGVEQVNAQNNDNRYLTLTYGENYTQLLSVHNGGASALANVVMTQKVPDRVGSSGTMGTLLDSTYVPPAPAGQDARTVYYYYKEGDADLFGQNIPADTPPLLFAQDGTTVNAWFRTTLPIGVTLSQVKWVAFLIPRLASPYFNETTGGLAGPSSVVAEMNLRIVSPTNVDQCPEYAVQGTASFWAYGYIRLNETTLVQNPGASTPVKDVELAEVMGVKPDLSVGVACSPSVREGAGEVTCTATVTNQQPGGAETDKAKNVSLTFDIPAVAVNGVSTRLPFQAVDAAGGTVWLAPDTGSGFVGLPSQVRVTWDAMAPGATRTVGLTLRVPAGLRDNTVFLVSAMVRGEDDYCGPTSDSGVGSVTVRVSPYLHVSKSVPLSVASAGTQMDYDLTVRNTGDGVSTRTWVVDRVPIGTAFVSAKGFYGEVWLSDLTEPDLPVLLGMDYEFDDSVVRAKFRPATASGGNWVAPPGMVPTYVAFLADVPTLSPPQFVTGTSQALSFTVLVDPAIATGTVLTNEALVLSDELIQSIGNRVRTVVSARPSIVVHHDCPEVVTSGEEYEYVVTYLNDSTNTDANALVGVTLPAGVTCVSLSHAYVPAQSYAIAPKCGDIVDGSLLVDVTANGHPLLPLKGGELRIRVKGDGTAGSGSQFLSESSGRAESAMGAVFAVYGQCASEVENADVTVRKVADVLDPLSDTEVTFSLLVANEGRHVAEGVVVEDQLPQGMTYVTGSTSVATAGWTLTPPDPDQSDGLYEGRPVKKLRWTGLKGSFVTGYMPGQSGDVLITFRAKVNADVTAGTRLENCVTVATTTEEDPVLPDAWCASVKVPLPDVWVKKDAPLVALPGSKATYVLTYGNDSKQAAQGVVLVDRLPWKQGAGASVKFTGVRAPQGTGVWFYAATGGNDAPSLLPSNPGANGWVQDAAGLKPTHIGLTVGALPAHAGPYRVEVDVELRDPDTGLELLPGVTVTNCATLRMTDGVLDGNVGNDTGCASTSTPSVDLALSLACDPDGGYPGTLPGREVAYALTVTNTGTVAAHGIYVDVPLSGSLEYLSDDGATSSVIGASGDVSVPVDLEGQPIASGVPWTRIGDRYYLGLAEEGSLLWFRKVGLLPGQSVTLTIRARVREEVPNETMVSNLSMVGTLYRADWQEGDTMEQEKGNNTDGCATVSYRSDVMVQKSVVDSSTGSGRVSDAGDTLRYTVVFDNLGGTVAQNVVIEDTLPDGVAFVPGSIAGMPVGVTVAYDDGTGTFSYVPTGGSTDPAIRAFRATFPYSMEAPVGGHQTVQGAGFDAGVYDGSVYDAISSSVKPSRMGTSSYTSAAMPSDAGSRVLGWKRLFVDGDLTTADGAATVSVLNALTGNPLPGLDTVLPDAAGLLDLSSVDVASVPRIKIRLNYEAPASLTAAFGWGNLINGQVAFFPFGPFSVISSNPWRFVGGGQVGTCGIDVLGALWCWGSNNSGQVGDGTTIDRWVPTHIGTATDWSSVVGGSNYTCGLRANGTIWCWGANYQGQFGDGTTNGSFVPKQVSGFQDWRDLSSGENNTCGIREGGTIWCWGANNSGQLGDGTTVQKLIPTQVGTEGGWTKVRCARYHTCALKSDKSLWCWGNNGGGQLGDGSSTNRLTPTPVNGGGQWVTMKGGNQHTCGIQVGGSLWCWGFNDVGQLGQGNYSQKNVPTRVPSVGNDNWVGFETASLTSCGIQSDHSLWCWGGNYYGEVNDGSVTNRTTPVRIENGTEWAMTSSGDSHTCGLRQDGTLSCWGLNDSAQLGVATPPWSAVPRKIDIGGLDWRQIKAGTKYACGIMGNGSLWSWGRNDQGQLGQGDQQDRMNPARVGSFADWESVSSGKLHTCGIRRTAAGQGLLYCWGANQVGEVGDNSTNMRTSPTAVAGADWVEVVTRNIGTCGRKSDQGLWCWGYNAYGQLGLGHNQYSVKIPAQVSPGSKWKSIGVAVNHSCGVKDDGTLWCWGYNSYGQLGLGNNTDTNAPTQVGGLSDWVSVVCGDGHSCGIRTNGSLYCWGNNSGGQLGLGNSNQGPKVPTLVGSKTWSRLSAKDYGTCGIQTDGSLWCWGQNSYNQAGIDSSRLAVSSPARVGNGSSWTDVSVGGECTLGLAQSIGEDVPGLHAIDVAYSTPKSPEFTYDAKVKAVCQTTATNVVNVATTTPEVSEGNNRAEAEISVNTADVSVAVSVGKGVAQDGDSLTYTVTWRNDGPSTAKNVQVVFTPPALTEGGGKTWNLGDLGPAASGSGTTAATVRTNDPGVSLVGRATIVTSTIDCVSSNDEARVTSVTGEMPNLWVRKSGPENVRSGAEATYVLTYGNDGNADTTGVYLKEHLPGGWQYVSGVPEADSGSPGTGTPTWNVGALAKGATSTVTVKLRAPGCDGDERSYVNEAEIGKTGGAGESTVTDNLGTAVTYVQAPLGLLELRVVPDRSWVAANDDLTYTVWFSNAGTLPVTNVAVTAGIPDGTSYETGSAGAGGVYDGQSVVWALGTLLAGQSGAVMFSVRAGASPVVLSGYATIFGDGACPATGDYDVSVVAAASDKKLLVIKTADTPDACGALGDTVTWTVAVKNVSDTTANGIDVTDVLSDPSTYIAGSIVGEGADATDLPTLKWRLASLSPGRMRTVSFSTRASNDIGPLLSNEAYSTASGGPGVTTSQALVRLACGDLLRLAKTVDEGCHLADSEATVVLSVTNRTTHTLTDVAVVDHLPIGATFVSSEDAGVYDAQTGTVRFAPSTIESGGATRVLHYLVRVPAASGGLLLGRAWASATGVSPQVSNDVTLTIEECADDGNICTKEKCSSSVGCYRRDVENGAPCNADSNGCTVDDSCQDGICNAGTRDACDDDNACTTDVCRSTGGDTYDCQNTLDDGFCMIDDACVPEGAANPLNQCQSCRPGIASDRYSNLDEGAFCDEDGNGCTVNDHCVAGACTAGTAFDCSDSKTCTDDSCSSIGTNSFECLYVVQDGACLVANSCYAAGDQSPDNQCESCRPTLSKVSFSDRDNGALCNADFNGCTADNCQAGECTVGALEACNDNKTCTADVCQSTGSDTHNCQHTLNEGFCQIDNACVAEGLANPLNQCQSCRPDVAQDWYSNLDNGTACNVDSDGCTVDDSCLEGACKAGTLNTCEDELACTTDLCVSTGTNSRRCQNTPKVGYCLVDGACLTDGELNPKNGCEACLTGKSATAWSLRKEGSLCNADSDGCTSDDSCKGGVCAVGNVACSDGDSCTVDSCQSTGLNSRDCAHASVDCSDGYSCTVDWCRSMGAETYVCENRIQAGSCLIAGTCYDREDQDADSPGCKSCLPEESQTAWSNAPDFTSCNADGNGCTLKDSCREGNCVAGMAPPCWDQHSCTADLCRSTGADTYICENPLRPDRCLIAGTCYERDEPEPNDPSCRGCRPEENQTEWSNVPDDTPCTRVGGGFCFAGAQCTDGTCSGGTVGCLVNGECWKEAARNPDDLCQVCNPSRDEKSWTGVDCTTDACHERARCEPESGLCRSPLRLGDTLLAIQMTDIGSLGGNSSNARSVNSQGRVVGESSSVDGYERPVTWTQADGMVQLAVDTNTNGRAYGINDDNLILGTVANPGEAARAFLWTQEGGLQVLGFVDMNADPPVVGPTSDGAVAGSGLAANAAGPGFHKTLGGSVVAIQPLPGGTYTRPKAITEAGHVVGEADTSGGEVHAFVWTATTGVVDLGTLGGKDSRAVAATEWGRVAGTSTDASGRNRAFTLQLGPDGTAGAMHDLGTLCTSEGVEQICGSQSFAAAMNGFGDVVGWSEISGGKVHAFLWSAEDGMKDLGSLVADGESRAYAINDHGYVVGVGDADGGKQEAFLWVPGYGIQKLGTLSGMAAGGVGIGSLGRVVGWSFTDDGQKHGFMTSEPRTTCEVCAADTESPIVNCADRIEREAPVDICGWIGDVTANLDDNCDGNMKLFIENRMFPVGTTEAFFEAEDLLGNKGSCTTQVTVRDVIAPEILCELPTEVLRDSLPMTFITTARDACKATVTIVDAKCIDTAADGSETDATGSCTLKVEGNRIEVGAPGLDADTVTWKAVAVDPSGNSSEAICRLKLTGNFDQSVALHGNGCAAGDGHGAAWPMALFLLMLALAALFVVRSKKRVF